MAWIQTFHNNYYRNIAPSLCSIVSMPPVCTTHSGWRSGSLCVTVAGEEVNSANPDLVVRTLTLESLVDQETDAVKMLHFTGWPEKGMSSYIHRPATI